MLEGEQIGKVKEALKQSKEEKGYAFGRTPSTYGNDGLRYDYVQGNSPLEGHSHSFGATFDRVIPDGMGFREYLESMAIPPERKGKAILVEFGGPGINLTSGLDEHLYAKTVGVTLGKIADDKGVIGEEELKLGNHEVMYADIFDSSTYRRLDHLLKEEKIDVIIERLLGGMDTIPLNASVFYITLNRWYIRLREGGVMLIQVPYKFNEIFGKWMRQIEILNNGIEVQYSADGSNDNDAENNSVFRLVKSKGSPEDLPELQC